MSLHDYIPMSGDVGFVGYEQGYKYLTDRISWWTTGRGETPTKADHQFQVIGDFDVVESGYGKKFRVTVRSWMERLEDCGEDERIHCIIFRPPMNLYQRDKINRVGREIDGYPYGFMEMPLQMGDGLLRKIGLLPERKPFFTMLSVVFPRTMICSGAGNYCLYRTGVLPHRALCWAPDDTFDEAVCRGWRIVAIDENGAAY